MNRRPEIPPLNTRRAALLLVLSWLIAPGSPLYPAPAGKRERQPTDSVVGGAATTSIDRLHPEAFRVPTWIEVDLPANQVTLKGLRVLTANRSWTMQVCGSSLDLSTCTTVVGPAGTAPGWRGDFRNESWTFPYQDREARQKLHLRVTPMGGDWMIFRIQTEARQ
jgi:hypothetical protein